MRYRTTIDVLVEPVLEDPNSELFAASTALKQLPATRHRYEVMGHGVDAVLAAGWVRGVLGPRHPDIDIGSVDPVLVDRAQADA